MMMEGRGVEEKCVIGGGARKGKRERERHLGGWDLGVGVGVFGE